MTDSYIEADTVVAAISSKTAPGSFKKFAHFMDGLKRSPRHLTALIALNLTMALASNIVDWHWITWVAGRNPWVLPFAPICSLYPLLMGIWGIWYYRQNHISPVGTKTAPQSGEFSSSPPNKPKNRSKKIPLAFTLFLFIGVVSYGIMAYIYFPLYMANIHSSWRVVGNMLWVTVYALQSLTILSELRPLDRKTSGTPRQRYKSTHENRSIIHFSFGLPAWQFLLIVGYFFFKDYSDRYLGSFMDVFIEGYPEWLKDFSFGILLVIHLVVALGAVKLLQARRSVPPAG